MRRVDPSVVLGWVFAQERKRQGLSQEAVARQLGTQQSVISRLEAGVLAATVPQLVTWERALGFAPGASLERVAHFGSVLAKHGMVLDSRASSWTSERSHEEAAMPGAVRAALETAVSRPDADPSS